MSLFSRVWLLLSILLCGTAALGASVSQGAYIGYVYPAGGQQSSTFQVTVRGQHLKSADGAYVSGNGVHASVISYEGASGPLSPAQREELKRRLEEIRAARSGRKIQGKGTDQQTGGLADKKKTQPVPLPDLPELRNLDKMTPQQLRQIADKFINNSKRPKPPIAEKVVLEINVDSDAVPGDREIRLCTPAGLSNPLVFQIGRIPEIREKGEDEDNTAKPLPSQPPVVLNGQIMPGEVDQFPVQLHNKQKIIIAVQARKLIPYLADAVPGWFQAVATIRDENGKELAYQDDCGFDPDPAFVFQAPHDGKYIIEIRDALYRGREDFIYRVDVVDESLARSIFPLGSRGGIPIGAAHIDKELCSESAREHFDLAAYPIPEHNETEPNNTGKASMRVKLPILIGGTISTSEDKDVYAFYGHAGDKIVAEVYARRMGSPLDSLLRLIDTSGRVIASNDDCEDPESGLLTHKADSYLLAKLPVTGRYFIQISDAQNHGGPEYDYYLRIGHPQPDFSLIMTPSSLNTHMGRVAVATVYAVRKDGWNGDIEIGLKGTPAGFKLSGAIIPKDQDQVRITLTPPRKQSGEPVALQIEGCAQINGKTIAHPVIPADDMMQAFAYFHLVPSKQLMLAVSRGSFISPTLDMKDGDRLRIPAGGTAQVSFSMYAAPNVKIYLELNNPPAGVTLQDVKTTPQGLTLTLKADEKHIGYANNLIIDAFREIDVKTGKGASRQKQRASIGVLPAVPFEIVQKGNMRS